MDVIKQKRTLVEETYDRLVDAICTGELSPGERLNQDEIAATLNVSRQPVNSAITLLRANGLVEDTGRRSMVVKPFDPELFRSIFEYRQVIEPFAVRLCQRRPKDSELKRGQRILDLGIRSSARGDIKGMVHADMQFHEMIYDWSGNQVIEMSMKTIWHHIRRSMAAALREPGAVQAVWTEHGEIFTKIVEGDVNGAAQVMEAHVRNAYVSLNEAMPSPQEACD